MSRLDPGADPSSRTDSSGISASTTGTRLPRRDRGRRRRAGPRWRRPARGAPGEPWSVVRAGGPALAGAAPGTWPSTGPTARRFAPTEMLERHLQARYLDRRTRISMTIGWRRSSVGAMSTEAARAGGAAGTRRRGCQPCCFATAAAASLPRLRARTEQILFDERFEEWFAPLGGLRPGLRGQRFRQLTAMRIAVAVFDGMPRHVAEAAADDLAAHLDSPLPPPRTSTDASPPRAARGPARLLDPDQARGLESSSSIVLERRGVPEGTGHVPGEVISYADDRMPVELLRWVWLTQYTLRGPMIAWLDGFSREPRVHVRLRAAQAAGLLCTIDFTHTLLEPCPAGRRGKAGHCSVLGRRGRRGGGRGRGRSALRGAGPPPLRRRRDGPCCPRPGCAPGGA